MFVQSHRLYGSLNPNEGFFVIGKNFQDCCKQLDAYHKQYPSHWIYFVDMGMKPASPIPVPEQVFEVKILKQKPETAMWFWNLFQRGI